MIHVLNALFIIFEHILLGQTSLSKLVKTHNFHSWHQGLNDPEAAAFKLSWVLGQVLSSWGEGQKWVMPEKHPVPYMTTGEPSATNCHEQYNISESSLKSCLFPSVDIQTIRSRPQIPRTIPSFLFSPYYCWCPPSRMIPASTPESYTLPPLSSLLATSASNLSEIPFLPLSMSVHNGSWYSPLSCLTR